MKSYSRWQHQYRELILETEKPYSRLEIGTNQPLLIRQESVDFGIGTVVKLLFASDLHLGWQRSPRAIAQLIAAVKKTTPDFVLLGGDLVDIPPGFAQLQDCVQQVSTIAPVWAIPGNHDQWVGVSRVRQAVLAGGGNWLTNSRITISGNHKAVEIHGSLSKNTQTAPNTISILCAHNPVIFPQAISQGYKLVFAGHLHGCQWVFGKSGDRLYPGAWFYTWNGLRFTQNQVHLLVSRGMGDTLPLRWNCPREVILCQIS
ncbi:metallophosphoesterase [Calothrix sp. 336/3]|uniref:metallophosphoesterase n=1 Tax=Calothrix sp. 336/3 TaxID=1337936 RepID=UPI0004E30A8F|nr:metallophosphoesterase [Calothrix sp. 336/3]AKG20842.1 hypothetical protein IJ00_05560 [Calothrix sp. 336/3]